MEDSIGMSSATTSSSVQPNAVIDNPTFSSVHRMSDATNNIQNSILHRPPIANSTTLNIGPAQSTSSAASAIQRRKDVILEISGIEGLNNLTTFKEKSKNDLNIYNQDDEENIIEELNSNADSTVNQIGSLKPSINTYNSKNHSETNERITRASKIANNRLAFNEILMFSKDSKNKI